MELLQRERALKLYIACARNLWWLQDNNYMKAKIEIIELYNWWKIRSKEEIEGKISPIWTENQYEYDNQMLIQLIKIRQYLWI